MRVNHNITAMLANNTLNQNHSNMAAAIERLSSGYRINYAKDDSAGLAISQKMRTQIRNIEQANRNAGDGISVIETAEGALTEVHNMLQRMKELAVKAANDTNCPEDRIAIQDEIDVMLEEMERISNATQFNNKNLLNGDIGRTTFIDTGSVVKGMKTLELSDAVPTESYEIKVTKDARQAVAVGGAIAMSESDVITAAQTGSITINGEKVEILEGDTAETVYGKIQDLCKWTDNRVLITDDPTDNTSGLPENAGYVANGNPFGNGGQLVIVSNHYGSKEEIEISCSNPNLSSLLGIDDTTVRGLDTEASLGTGFPATAVLSTDGRTVTVKDNGGFLMVMETKLGACATAFSDVTMGSTDTEATTAGGTAFDSKIDVLDAGQMVFQIGANSEETMTVTIPRVSPQLLGIDDMNVVCGRDARDAIAKVDDAIRKVSDVRSKLGAYQNRLEHTEENLAVSDESMTASLSRILDADMAEQMTIYTQQNLLTQTATSMLAKANAHPESILQLLQQG